MHCFCVANVTVEQELDYENTSATIRLSQGVGYSEGRVEVTLDDVWYTICDPNWDITDANAVCNELGFGGAITALSHAYFGEGTGPIIAKDRNCTGNEESVGYCFKPLRENGNCSHRNDVGVICFRTYFTTFV